MLSRALLFLLVSIGIAQAQAPSSEEQLRAAFARGLEFEKQQDWGLALHEFRQAAPLATGRNVAVIEFNIAVCERALGHFLSARQVLRSLQTHLDLLDESRQEEVRVYFREMDALTVRVPVTIVPASAALSVDGGPLIVDPDEDERYLGGLSHDASAIVSIERTHFMLLLDRGAHVFRASRPGHKDAVVVGSYGEGAIKPLDLKLDELPATITVKSLPVGAVVKVDGREAGITPIDITRNAGRYDLAIEHERYQAHREQLNVVAGEHVDVTAPLELYRAPLTRKWWFWTAIASVVAVGAISTYFAARPDPAVPPYDRGSADWLPTAP